MVKFKAKGVKIIVLIPNEVKKTLQDPTFTTHHYANRPGLSGDFLSHKFHTPIYIYGIFQPQTEINNDIITEITTLMTSSELSQNHRMCNTPYDE